MTNEPIDWEETLRIVASNEETIKRYERERPARQAKHKQKIAELQAMSDQLRQQNEESIRLHEESKQRHEEWKQQHEEWKQRNRMTNGNLETRVAALEAQMQQVQATLQQVADLQIAGQQQLNQLGNRLEQLEQLQERAQRQIEITLNIANSNARSIQAWEALIEQNKVEAEEERSELRVATNNLQTAINELIRANQQNTIDHELFRRRFEAIDPLIEGE